VGLYLPDSGECFTLGVRADELTSGHMARVGYVAQEGELLEWLSVRQFIGYVRAYYDRWNESLEQRLVAEFALPLRSRIAGLSPGVRQRLAILLAVCPEPDLLILDEPASALDPIARAQFLDLLVEIIQAPERTIIISSHILSDVEKVVDHVLIMHAGRLLRDCGFEELQEEYSRLSIRSAAPLPADLGLGGELSRQFGEREAEVVVRGASRAAIAAFERAHQATVEVHGLGLEDLYRCVMQSQDTGQ
jgi:ABC-2 type transport system ATP-binding protein